MYAEYLGVLVIFLLVALMSFPVGRYLARVFAGQPIFGDRLLLPLERGVYRLAGIDPTTDMSWKTQLRAMLGINTVWFVMTFVVLIFQDRLPLNPDANAAMTPDLAFNTAISFLVNCNLQHYAGESGLSYLSQLVLMSLQFLSAATGIAIVVTLFNAFKQQSNPTTSNFYVYLVKSITRFLLPISLLAAVVFLWEGVPMTFEGKASMVSVVGDSVQVPRGPLAAFVPIKHLGTNGGGFMATNSAHPLENPSYFTAMIQMILQMLVPMALVFAFGFYIQRKRLAWMIFGVMTIGFLLLVVPTIWQEVQGNPLLTKMGVSSASGALEGKELRFGSALSAYWSIATTVISTGSVNAMHDSMMPLSGLFQLLAMMVNGFYGGCGVGLLNFFVFIILAVFMSGLMVGRTPEFLGRKVEAREMKIAMMIALLHPLLILVGTALSCFLFLQHPASYATWLNNPGYHGFSEMLYEFTSAAANNGSGFEGLGDNTPWWNISTGIVMLLGRFLPIIGPVAIAGLLQAKRPVPESAGTLQTDTATFGVMIMAVIVIITALSFFSALALGPIAEHLQFFL